MKHSVLLLILVAVLSCTEVVQTEFPAHPAVPVVNGLLREGSPIAIHVSLASGIDKNELSGYDEAIVELYIDDEFAEVLEPMGDGWYSSNLIAKVNVNYACVVSIPGFDVVRANTLIPEPMKILDVAHHSIAGKDEEGMTYPSIEFTFENDPGEKVFYEARIRVFSYKSERIPWQIRITDPVLLNEGLPVSVFSNEIIKDDKYTMIMNYFAGSAGSSGEFGELRATLFPLIFELRSVHEDYYRFARQKYLYETGRYPEFGLNANTAFPMYSNVENGFGIFTGFSSVATDTIFPTY